MEKITVKVKGWERTAEIDGVEGLERFIKGVLDTYLDNACEWGVEGEIRTVPGALTNEEFVCAMQVRNIALKFWRQNPQSPDLPEAVKEPIIELQNLQEWCIKAWRGTLRIAPSAPSRGRKVDNAREKAVLQLLEFVKKGDLSDMPITKKADARNWLAEIIKFPYDPSNDSDYARGKAMDDFLRNKHSELHGTVNKMIADAIENK